MIILPSNPKQKPDYSDSNSSVQIIPTGEEIVPAAVYFAQALLAKPIPYLRNDTRFWQTFVLL